MGDARVGTEVPTNSQIDTRDIALQFLWAATLTSSLYETTVLRVTISEMLDALAVAGLHLERGGEISTEAFLKFGGAA